MGDSLADHQEGSLALPGILGCTVGQVNALACLGRAKIVPFRTDPPQTRPGRVTDSHCDSPLGTENQQIGVPATCPIEKAVQTGSGRRVRLARGR